MLPIVYLQALLLNLRRLSYGLLTAIGLFGLSCHAADDNKDTLALLVHASAQRLALADDVALSKWQHAQAVEDKAREHIVIASAITKAAAYHLNAEQVSYFFADQIEANKWVQYALIAHWHRTGPPATDTPINLAKTIRPKLDALQTQLLQLLAHTQTLRERSDCPSITALATDAYAKQQSLDALHTMALDRAFVHFCKK